MYILTVTKELILNLHKIFFMLRPEFIQKTPPFLRNKFVFAGLVFLVWISFFDDSSIVSRISKARELHKLEQQKEHYIKEIDTLQKRFEELKGDEKALEKFAREQYLMKKKNEDIFIIEEED